MDFAYSSVTQTPADTADGSTHIKDVLCGAQRRVASSLTQRAVSPIRTPQAQSGSCKCSTYQ